MQSILLGNRLHHVLSNGVKSMKNKSVIKCYSVNSNRSAAIRINQIKGTLPTGRNRIIAAIKFEIVGNLDTDVDEKMLYDTFSTFGTIISTPKVRFYESSLLNY